MAGGSTTAVYTAIAGNSLVMVAKFAAFAVTGSPAMLGEGIHSMADVGNQTLMAIGIRKSQEPPTPEYPFGRAKERFIWALISAVGIFFLGCGVTVYHGVEAALHPHEYEGSVWVLLGVLLFSAIVEGGTFVVALRAVNEAREGRGWIKYFKEADDPLGPAVLLEDGAAVLGVCLAALGIGLSMWTGSPIWDAVFTIVIGLMLGLIAIALVQRNRQLLLGESVPQEFVDAVEKLLEAQPEIDDVQQLRAVVVGAGEVRLQAEVDFDGAELVRGMVTDADVAAVIELHGEEAVRGWLEEFGQRMIEGLGDAVDRIEGVAREAHPKLKQLDLEAD